MARGRVGEKESESRRNRGMEKGKRWAAIKGRLTISNGVEINHLKNI